MTCSLFAGKTTFGGYSGSHLTQRNPGMELTSSICSSSAGFTSRLAKGPRLAGQVGLNAYDAALHGIFNTQCLQYEGLLPVEALEAGLAKAVAVFPVVLGWLERQPDDNTWLLRWDTSSGGSSSRDHPRFAWEVCSVRGSSPNLWSNWELWRKAGLAGMAAGGRLAAAKVIIYPDGGQSLLLFSWDHMLFDYNTGFKFLQLWLSTAAAAAAGDAAAVDAASCMLPTPCFSRACYQHCAAAVAAAPGLSIRSKECTCRPGEQQCQEQQIAEQQQQPAWSIPVAQHDCFEWARQQSKAGSSSISHFCSIDTARWCAMCWKVMVTSLRTKRSVWRIPRHLLEKWKAAADTACPLPPGLHYSANVAMWSVLASTLYAADPRKADQQGGLHVNVVVDVRDGRCGMAVPAAAASNASVWGVRTWVPLSLLQEAAAAAGMLPASSGGRGASSSVLSSSNCGDTGDIESGSVAGGACPALMRHLALELQWQLTDSAGHINKQFEWWEAVRRAGLSGRAYACLGLPHTDAADITFDCLRESAWDLAPMPGCRLAAASVRWMAGYLNRLVMTSRAPQQQHKAAPTAACVGTGIDGCSGHDIQLEVTVPGCGAMQLWQAWRCIGLQPIYLPGAHALQLQFRPGRAAGAIPSMDSSGSSCGSSRSAWVRAVCPPWQVVEPFLLPGVLLAALRGAVGCLPWLLLSWCLQLCRWLCGRSNTE